MAAGNKQEWSLEAESRPAWGVMVRPTDFKLSRTHAVPKRIQFSLLHVKSSST